MISANFPFSMPPICFFQAADLLLPIVIEHVGGRQIRGLDGFNRSQSPFGVVLELVVLLSGGNRSGRGNALPQAVIVCRSKIRSARLHFENKRIQERP